MENIQTLHYSAGESIIKEGDHSNDVFLIISGAVEITKKTGKKDIILSTQRKNTIFGEMNIIDGKNRSAPVQATEDTYCYKANTIEIAKELGSVDKELLEALKSMVTTIRNQNIELAQIRKHNEQAINDYDVIDN